MSFPLHVVHFSFRDYEESELERLARPVIARGRERKLGQSESRRRSYFAGRVAVAAALRAVGFADAQIAPDPEFGFLTVVGKEKEVFVNLSHSGDFAVAAVGPAPIGIDVERGDRVVERALRRVAVESEWALIRRYPTLLGDGGSIASDLALWCGKEACSKAVGLGIKFGMQAFEIAFSTAPPLEVAIHLSGPLELAQPGLRYAWVQGHVIAICTEMTLLQRPWPAESLLWR